MALSKEGYNSNDVITTACVRRSDKRAINIVDYISEPYATSANKVGGLYYEWHLLRKSVFLQNQLLLQLIYVEK